MGVNISGSGILSGIASLIVGAVNNLNLLVTRIIGYTTGGGGGGGSSYYTTTTEAIVSGIIGWSKDEDKTLYYSSNGVQWEKILASGDLTSTDWARLNHITYGNQKFVAVDNMNNVAAYSTDGVNWIKTSLPSSSDWRDVAYGNGIFVVTGGSDKVIAYSIDGINWTQVTMPGNFSWYEIKYLDNKFVTMGKDNSNNSYISTSTDGIVWTTPSALPSGIEYSVISYGAGKFVVASALNNTAYSVDLVNWTVAQNLPFTWVQDIVYANGKFVALRQYSGTTAYSTDGIEWTQGATQDPSLDLGVSYNIMYTGSEFVFLAKNNSNTLLYSFYSTDGINWTSAQVRQVLSWQYAFMPIEFGQIKKLVETQISIGDQGSGGAEVLAPVDVYTVPSVTTTDIDEVRIKNNSGNTITYDLAVLNPGVELTDQNALVNDQAVLAGATATVTSITTPMTAGQRIVVFPSAVDVVEVKVYGTETIDQQGVTFQASGIHFADLNGNVYISMNRDGFDSSVLANNGGTNLTIAFDELVELFYGPELDGFNGQTFTILESGFEDENYGTYIVVDASFSVGAPFGEAFRQAISGTIEIFGL